MDKDAVKYLVELQETKLIDVDGKQYSTNRLHEVREPTPEGMSIHTLTGLMGYINGKVDLCNRDEKIVVQVISPTDVRVQSELFGEFLQRGVYVDCDALVPYMELNKFMDGERFIVMLQSMFVDTPDRASVLKLAGNVREENIKSTGDDGISQQVTAKVGIARVEDAIVPNPVLLSPYRTFQEVCQPISPFIFRMKDGPQFALFDADGGMWRNVAIESIENYIEEQLDDELVEFVSIIA